MKLEGGKISKETIGNVSSMTQMTIGDEFHYILQCQYFEQNCKHLTTSFFRKKPNVLKFKHIMTIMKKADLLKLCKMIKFIDKRVCAPCYVNLCFPVIVYTFVLQIAL